jgi:hypothetical protein
MTQSADGMSCLAGQNTKQHFVTKARFSCLSLCIVVKPAGDGFPVAALPEQ